jgi:DNA helicase-2/ATP-dependent DNA helicase PcrA
VVRRRLTINERSHGLVVNRLEGIYERLYVDEVQDIAGYDLLVLEALFRSKIKVYAVGDPRQATYATNMAPKYRKYRGKNIADLFSAWKDAGICAIEEMNTSYRSNQMLCDFADALYPEMARTVSVNLTSTGHDGVFLVHSGLVAEYYATYKPRVLRYDIRSKDFGLPSLNFGMAKGTTCDRVLIVPTKKIEGYLATGDPSVVGAVAKLYVAITRARHSTAFVFDGDCSLPGVTRYEA